MLKGLGGLGDMAGMMKKAKEMQSQMEQIQQDLHSIMVVGESGAGLVKATATAKGNLTALEKSHLQMAAPIKVTGSRAQSLGKA